MRVSTENGAIKQGDYLTSSSLPGVAMRASHAGLSIGLALEDLVLSSASSTSQTILLPDNTTIQVRVGNVLVFVNVGYVGNDLTLSRDDKGILQEDDMHLIDSKGNVLAFTQDGDIVVKHLVVKNLELAQGGSFTLPAGEGQIIGHATVHASNGSLVVTNILVHPESEIFLSLEGPAPKSGYSITGKKEGEFTLSLYAPASYDLKFTYWIVNTYSPNGARSTDQHQDVSGQKEKSQDAGGQTSREETTTKQPNVTRPAAQESTSPATSQDIVIPALNAPVVDLLPVKPTQASSTKAQ